MMPILVTPQAMIDTWTQAFKSISPPEMLFIHWMYDMKAYFGLKDKNSNILDKSFGGHGTSRGRAVRAMKAAEKQGHLELITLIERTLFHQRMST